MSEVLAGRYRLGPLIGRGGMADVHAGDDLFLHRPVAVKLLRAEWAADPAMRRRFHDEARAAARLSHPNAVTVYDTGEHEQRPFIVMERLPGRSVADELDAGPLAVERAVTIAGQVCGALEAAHAQGVVHRDIKPANLLLTESGDVKVADFGIAKIADSHDLTITGFVVGTPAYLAPERLAGATATPAADIYAVGVFLYQALTGSAPFSGDSPLAVLGAISSGAVPRLARRRPDLDPRLVAAVERAMAPDPARRYASAAQLRAALGPLAAEATGRGIGSDVTVVRPHATAVLPAPLPRGPVHARTTAAARPPRPMPSARGPARWWAAGLAAAFGVAAVITAVAVAAGDGDDDPPTTTRAASPTTLPEPLARAIDELEQLVGP